MQHAVGQLFSSASRALLSARRPSGRDEDVDDADARDSHAIARENPSSGARVSASAGRNAVSTSPLKRLSHWLTPRARVEAVRDEVRDEDFEADEDATLRTAGATSIKGTAGPSARGRRTSDSGFATTASRDGASEGARKRARMDATTTTVLKETTTNAKASLNFDHIEGDVQSTQVVKPTTSVGAVSPDIFALGRKKKGSSGLPVKNIDFDAAGGDGGESPDENRTTMSPPTTSGRRPAGQMMTPVHTGATPHGAPSIGMSPNIGGILASPNIVARVGDVLANLDVDSEDEAETEEEEDDYGGTQTYDDGMDDYAGGTQVLDSAELCEAPSRLDLAIAPKVEEPEVPCARGGDAVIRILRRRLFGVNRERPVSADGLDFAANLKAHRDHLLNMLEDTVSGGQNNSVLMVGNRGSGKTLILDSALKMLEDRHPGKVVTVYLNGLLHADERIGMQKVAAQLCPNLSEDSIGRSAGGFAENVAFMTEMLKLLQGGRRGVIFVLDEFELFAMRSKQTLLYAITDLLQQPHVQAAVVGVTCRHSIDRLLEKRVASRFSNRRIVVAPPGSTVSMVDGVTKALKLTDKDKHLCPSEPDFVQQWNLSLRAAMLNAEVKNALEQFGRLENTPASVSKMACAILSRVNRSLGKVTALDIVDAAKSMDRNPFVSSLTGVTPLELLLCVAMYRMHRARQRPSFTFDALAQELNEMGSKEQLTHAKDCGRSVLVRAFENLLTLGIATAHKSGSGVRGAALKEYKNIVFVVADEELREAIRRHPNAIPGLADYMEHENLRAAHTV